MSRFALVLSVVLVIAGITLGATAVARGWSPLVFYAGILIAGAPLVLAFDRHEEHRHRRQH